jgi:hypothetical protein
MRFQIYSVPGINEWKDRWMDNLGALPVPVLSALYERNIPSSSKNKTNQIFCCAFTPAGWE